MITPDKACALAVPSHRALAEARRALGYGLRTGGVAAVLARSIRITAARLPPRHAGRGGVDRGEEEEEGEANASHTSHLESLD